MKFRDLPVDTAFRFSRDSELNIGRAVFQKDEDGSAFVRDSITIDPDTEVELLGDNEE